MPDLYQQTVSVRGDYHITLFLRPFVFFWYNIMKSWLLIMLYLFEAQLFQNFDVVGGEIEAAWKIECVMCSTMG